MGNLSRKLRRKVHGLVFIPVGRMKQTLAPDFFSLVQTDSVKLNVEKFSGIRNFFRLKGPRCPRLSPYRRRGAPPLSVSPRTLPYQGILGLRHLKLSLFQKNFPPDGQKKPSFLSSFLLHLLLSTCPCPARFSSGLKFRRRTKKICKNGVKRLE